MQKPVSSAEVQIPRITVLKNYLFEIEASQKKKKKQNWIHFPSPKRTWGHHQDTGLDGSLGHSSVFESLLLGAMCLN